MHNYIGLKDVTCALLDTFMLQSSFFLLFFILLRRCSQLSQLRMFSIYLTGPEKSKRIHTIISNKEPLTSAHQDQFNQKQGEKNERGKKSEGSQNIIKVFLCISIIKNSIT